MVGLLPVAPHDGLGGRHHMVPHILRGACNVQLSVVIITIIVIIIMNSNHDSHKKSYHDNSKSNDNENNNIVMMLIMISIETVCLVMS